MASKAGRRSVFTPPNMEAFEIPPKPEELEVLSRQYHKEGHNVTIQTKFNYAYGLLKSSERGNIEKAMQLLSEIFAEDLDRRRECLFFLSVGHYKLGNFSEAKKVNQELLKRNPRDRQALDLQKRIEDTLSREGVIGLAIVSGAVAVGAALIAAIVKRSK